MASLDLSTAIQNFDPKKHNYLAVKKEKGNVHLAVSHKTRFGRLWMSMGMSNASMTRVLKYLISQSKNNSEALTSLTDVNKLKLLQRVEKFEKKHKQWCKKHQIAALMTHLKPSTAPVKPEEKPAGKDKEGGKESGGTKEGETKQGEADSSKNPSQQHKESSKNPVSQKPLAGPSLPLPALTLPPQLSAPTMQSSSAASGSAPTAASAPAPAAAKPVPAPQPPQPSQSIAPPAQPSQPVPATQGKTETTAPVPAISQPKPVSTAPKPTESVVKFDTIDQQLSTSTRLLTKDRSANARDVLRKEYILDESRVNPWKGTQDNLSGLLVTALQERQAYLDQEFNLSALSQQLSIDEKRILTAEDLDLPYEQSAFKIMLMSKEQFLALSMDGIQKLSPRQIEAFNQRAKILESEIDQAAFYAFVHGLESEGVLQLSQATLVPEILWSYVSEETLKSIPTDKLDDKLMACLFVNDYCKHSELVTADQLKVIVQYLQQADKLAYIPRSRLNDVIFSKELFHTVFPEGGDKESVHQQNFAKLSITTIERYLEFMDAARMAYLSDEQISQLDAGKLSRENLEALQKVGKIGKLEKAQLTVCWANFNEASVKGLTREQLPWLDPSEHQFTKKLFESRFVKDRAKEENQKDFEGLSQPMVVHLLQFMKAVSMAYLSDRHICDLDTTRLNANHLAGLALVQKIQLFTEAQLTNCWGQFDEDSIKALSDDQLGKLNPTDNPFSSPLLGRLFPIPASQMRDVMMQLHAPRFHKLSDLMVNHMLQFMERGHMVYLSAGQVRALDPKKMQRHHFEGLCVKAENLPNINYLEDGQIKDLWTFVDKDSIGLLTLPQISGLDTVKLTKELFNALFVSSSALLQVNQDRMNCFGTDEKIKGITGHLQRRKDLHRYLSADQKKWAGIK